MRVRIFTLLLLLFSLNSQAQSYEINLSEYKFEKPINNVSVERIIDLRYDKTNIGWIYKGFERNKVAADFAATFPEALGTFIRKNSVPTNNAIPVILKVNKFTISEKVYGDRDYGMAEIAIEFLAKSGKGYVKLADAGSFVQVSSLSDVTGKHEENIVKALEDCFAELQQFNLADKIRNSPVLGEEYLQVNTYYQAEPSSIKILTTNNPQKGFYRNFREFKNNAPGFKEEFYVNDKGKLINSETGEKIRMQDFWGFSDGKTVFFKYGDNNNFFPLEKKDNQFTFTGLVTTVNSGTVAMGSVLGGMVGGAIAGALSQDTKAITFILNPITGSVSEAAGENTHADLAKKAKIVVYRNGRNEAPAKLSLYVNENLMAELMPNSTSELTFNVPVNEMEFCLRSEDNECITFTPVLDQTRYLECSLPKKDGSFPEIRPVSEKEGNYYLKIIRFSQKQSKSKSK